MAAYPKLHIPYLSRLTLPRTTPVAITPSIIFSIPNLRSISIISLDEFSKKDAGEALLSLLCMCLLVVQSVTLSELGKDQHEIDFLHAEMVTEHPRRRGLCLSLIMNEPFCMYRMMKQLALCSKQDDLLRRGCSRSLLSDAQQQCVRSVKEG